MAVEARRGKLGMSREDLAAKAGIDPKTIYNLEKNGKWPIARTRARIEEALGWPSGEMERVAAAPAPALQPAIPSEVLRVIRRNYSPEQQQEIIEMLGELSGQPADDRSGSGRDDPDIGRAG